MAALRTLDDLVQDYSAQGESPLVPSEHPRRAIQLGSGFDLNLLTKPNEQEEEVMGVFRGTAIDDYLSRLSEFYSYQEGGRLFDFLHEQLLLARYRADTDAVTVALKKAAGALAVHRYPPVNCSSFSRSFPAPPRVP